MANLGLQLRETIWNLEELRDKEEAPPEQLIKQINTLYDQLIDLVSARIDSATVEYGEAATAMEEAAAKSQRAIKGLAKTEETLETVGKAIEKVAALLIAAAAL